MTEPAVADVVAAVLDGRLSLSHGRALLIVTDSVDDWDRFAADRAAEVRSLLARIREKRSTDRIITMAELAAAAALPVSATFAAQTWVLVAAVHYAYGDDKRLALDYLERAIPLLKDLPDAYLVSRRQRLRVLVDLGDHATFEADSPAVLALAQRQGAHGDLVLLLIDAARSLAARGQLSDAVSIAQYALGLWNALTADETEGVDSMSHEVHQIGMFAQRAGRYEDALTFLEAARDLAVTEGNEAFAAFVLSEIGFTWALLGDRPRADGVLGRAADEARRVGRTDWVAHWDGGSDGNVDSENAWKRACALMRFLPERADEAASALRTAIAEAKRDDEQSVELMARNNLGLALSEAGRPHQAEIAFRAAIIVAHRAGDPMLEIAARANLSAELMFRRRFREVLAEVGQALTLGERLRDDTMSTELRQSLSAVLARCYDIATFVAAVPWPRTEWMIATGQDPAVSESQPDVLIEIGQRARAANLLRALRISATVERTGDPELVDAMLGLRAADIEVELAATEGRPIAQLMAARTEAAQKLAAVHRSDLAGQAATVGIAELAAGLRDGEVLVDLQTTPMGVSVCCVTASGPPVAGFWPLLRADRYALLRRLGRARRQYMAQLCEETERDLATALAALDTNLLDYVVAMVGEGVRRVFVCPENELFQIPFWRLSAPLGDVAVTVLPTSGALPLLRSRDRSRPAVRLSVADPTGSLPHSTKDIPVELGYVPCDPSPTALLCGLPGAGRVHFACHGIYDEWSVQRSGLVVLADDGADDSLGAPYSTRHPDWHVFTAAQIAGRLHLPECELVVLAACDSGLPRDHDANEFTSLPGAFLVAGARNVVASLWPAHDGAAALLMNEFYRRHEHGGVAAALAGARAALAAMSRDEVTDRLGTSNIPPGAQPFANTLYTDCFQHYGVD